MSAALQTIGQLLSVHHPPSSSCKPVSDTRESVETAGLRSAVSRDDEVGADLKKCHRGYWQDPIHNLQDPVQKKNAGFLFKS